MIHLLSEQEYRLINILNYAKTHSRLSLNVFAEVNACSYQTAKSDFESIRTQFPFIIERADDANIQFKDLTHGNLELIGERILGNSPGINLLALIFFFPHKNYNFYAEHTNSSPANFYRLVNHLIEYLPEYGMSIIRSKKGYEVTIEDPVLAYPLLSTILPAIAINTYGEKEPIGKQLFCSPLFNDLFDHLKKNGITVSQKTIIWFYWNMIFHYVTESTLHDKRPIYPISVEHHHAYALAYANTVLETFNAFKLSNTFSDVISSLKEARDNTQRIISDLNFEWLALLIKLFITHYEIFPFKYELFGRHRYYVCKTFEGLDSYYNTLLLIYDSTRMAYPTYLEGALDELLYLIGTEAPIRFQPNNKSVLVVNNFSVRNAYSIAKSLERQFPNHYFDYVTYHPLFSKIQKNLNDYDLIISSCTLDLSLSIPIVFIEDYPDTKDIEKISRFL